MIRDDARPAVVEETDTAGNLRRRLSKALERAETSGDAQLARDIEEALALEDALLGELRHRVRNILAMLRSVIARTAAKKTDVQDYIDHLQARIDAIARTQTMFLRSPGRAIELEDIILDELVAQAAEIDKIALHGPELSVPPKAAEVLGLAVHELAINSVKFGALGDRRGSVQIRWSVTREAGQHWVRLLWQERGLDFTNLQTLGGGFGTELITKRIPYEIGGRGELSLEPDGLSATIDFPLEEGSLT